MIREYLKDIASKHNISDSDAYDILVSVGEATTNAIEHGGGGFVEVTCDLATDVLNVTVKSKGVFSKKTPPSEEDNFRGRGILLMLALMDCVNIDDSKDGVIVTMSKSFKQAS